MVVIQPEKPGAPMRAVGNDDLIERVQYGLRALPVARQRLVATAPERRSERRVVGAWRWGIFSQRFKERASIGCCRA
ncbi:hypothetical protein [Verminephrobacter eiseniae]|nr:hypothetical protein [Verminephrobacter eiseniae]